MGDLTKNLSRYEFDSSDGQRIATDYEIVLAVQDSCDFFENITGRTVKVKITSPYRSPQVNARTKNTSRNSYHLKNMAVDYWFLGFGSFVSKPNNCINYLVYPRRKAIRLCDYYA